MTKPTSITNSRERPEKLRPASRSPVLGYSLDNKAEYDEALRRSIFAIPAGKVSTYGRVAAAAGYPRHHRAVARLLQLGGWEELPWHRVVGADRQLKTSGASAKEQQARLRLEGIRFVGNKVASVHLLQIGEKTKQRRPEG